MFELGDELIYKIINKDKDSFNIFYSKSVDIFYRYVKSNYFIQDSDINDIVSDFYLKVWNGLVTYKTFYNFESWIWTIFKNHLKDYFKKSKEISFSSLDKNNDESVKFEDELISNDDILEFIETSFKYDIIIQAIGKLDESYREVIFLKFVEEKSNKEISVLLSINEELVRQRVSRALKKLKEYLTIT